MKKILSILVCVCVLLSAIVITASAAATEIVFEFGANGSATHNDGSEISAGKTYTSGDYTLKLTSVTKCYGGAFDAKGNSALKLGTSKLNGGFSFTAPDAVTSVIIKVAQYKSNSTKVKANGTEYTISTASNNGAYTDITIDTTSTKAITFETSGSTYRCMVDSITYVIADTSGDACTHAATSTEANGNETHKVVCDDCGETVIATVDCTDADINGKCDVCDGTVELPAEKTIAEVFAMADGDTKFYVTAEIVDTYRDTWATYGNFILKDDSTEDTIIMYGLKDKNGNRYDAMTEKPVVGDTIKVIANRSSYNNVGQLANAVLVEIIPATTPSCEHTNTSTEPNGDETHKVVCDDCGEPVHTAVDCTDADANGKCDECEGDVEIPFDPSTATPAEIVDAAYALDAGAKLEGITLTGTITEIVEAYSEQYGNITVKIAIAGKEDKPINCKRMVVDNATEVEVGDTITVTGDIENNFYNNVSTIQFYKPTLDDVVKADGGEVTPPADDEIVADNAKISFEDAANRTTSTETQQVWTENGVTVTYDKNTYNNNLAEYHNPARFYKGTSVTIAYPQMTGIVIKAAKDSSKDYITAWSDSFDASLATAIVDDATVIIALNEAADTFVLELTAQARAYTITVYTGEFNADDFIDSTPAFDPTGKTAAEIVDAAYALESGTAFESNATLTGEIVNIDTPYSEQYGNITVTIKVDGADATKTIMCYRLSGEGADTLAVGDKITVTGIIKNYNGTIEFDQGCTLDALVKGEGEIPVAPENPKEIVDAAFALEAGKTLPYSATLTGKITNIEKINEQYGDVCLTIAVEGSDGEKELYCYNLKPTEGIDLATLAVGDVITVTGNLKNYNGTIEFISCSFELASTDAGEEDDDQTDDDTSDDTTDDTTGDTTDDTTTDTNGNGATNDTTSPVTGDNVGALAMVAIAAAAVILYTNKKR